MKDIKKTRSGEATPKRAQAGAGFSRSSTSTNHSTTSAAGRQIQIADFLLRGQKNALPLRHLKEMTGLPGRDLRRQIEVADWPGCRFSAMSTGILWREINTKLPGLLPL